MQEDLSKLVEGLKRLAKSGPPAVTLDSIDAAKKFIQANALPLVVEFNHETAQKIFSGEIKSHLLMFVSKKSDEFKAQHETAQTIAKEYKGQLLFVTIGMFLVSFKDFF